MLEEHNKPKIPWHVWGNPRGDFGFSMTFYRVSIHVLNHVRLVNGETPIDLNLELFFSAEKKMDVVEIQNYSNIHISPIIIRFCKNSFFLFT